MNIHRVLNTVVRPFRIRRMARFLEVVAPAERDRILDVGGTEQNWLLANYSGDVTLLNLSLPKGVSTRYKAVVGDGTKLEFEDKSFDVCFSNSVIEHVGGFEEQKRFAQEVCRVGKRVWVQTPAREFFLEPHYLTPFIHWMPTWLQKLLLRNFSVWGLMARPTQDYVDQMVDQTRLLTYAEVKAMFPDCHIYRERFLLMTKSYVAVSKG